MNNPDITVITRACDWLQQQPVWLCTVLSTWGSSPRSPGAMMAATRDGRYCGSLSGGCVEQNFLTRIAAGEYRLPSQLVRYGGGGLAPDIALPCGGTLEVLVEFLPAGADSIAPLQKMQAALASHRRFMKTLTLPGPCQLIIPAASNGSTGAERTGNTLRLHIAAPPQLLIAGLSSVAIASASFACALGFEVLVCESRPEALANFVPALPPEVTLLEQFPARYLELHGCHASTAIVALTHDARMDDLTLMEAIHTPAFYIGAMGSQKNSDSRRQRLQRIAEFSAGDLARIHAPVGLALGGKKPAEIALAVMADIVRVKNCAPVSPLPGAAL